MKSAFAIADHPAANRLQYFFQLHPEWWSVALCWLAWAVMLFRGWPVSDHAMHDRAALAQELPNWMLMVAAMMLPLVMDSVRSAAFSSRWSRRHRAIAEFLLGYSGPWFVLGITAAGLRQFSWTHTYGAVAAGFAVAALWQLTRAHRRAMLACYRTRPLAPVGWRADRDCLHYGLLIGVASVRSCWPLMLACAFTGHSLIAMTAGMAVSAVECWSYRPRPRTVLAGILCIAAFYAALALFDPSFVFGAQPQPVPEIIGATQEPFYLDKGITQISIPMQPPDRLSLSNASSRRIYLNVESITSKTRSASYDVYLNLPPKHKPDQRRDWYAGPLPMFGLVQASRPDGEHPAPGLYEQLDVTQLFVRLAALPDWDPKNLRVSFVPRNAGAVPKIRVGRVTVSMTRTTP